MTVTKYLREINLKEGRCIFDYGVRGFSPRSAGSIAFKSVENPDGKAWQREAPHLMKAKKQKMREQEREDGAKDELYSSKANNPRELRPPTGSHVLIPHSAMN
jgi:hypothetical protein